MPGVPSRRRTARRRSCSPPEHCSRRTREPSDVETREALSGVLCRCTGYVKILQAVEGAAALMRGEEWQASDRCSLRRPAAACRSSPPNPKETTA